MFDEFAGAQHLTDERELLLGSIEGGDGAVGPVCAVEVPCVEAGEVLDGAEEFVAADWRGGYAVSLGTIFGSLAHLSKVWAV